MIEGFVTPELTEGEAEEIARCFYGLRTRALALPGERDRNFLLRGDSGQEFVLKVVAPGERREALELQDRVLAHLSESTLRGVVPRVLPTRSGEPMAFLRGGGESSLRVRLLTHLPGTPLAQVRPHSAQLLDRLGSLLGRLDGVLQGLSDRSFNRDCDWDLKNALRFRLWTSCISDVDRRLRVEEIFREFEDHLQPVLQGLRRSLIHNDANDYNILVQDRGLEGQRISGLIDFGDLVLTHTVCEVAIAAAYAMLDKRDPVGAAARVVGGYHREFPLTETELELIYPLLRTRLAVSVTNAARQRERRPQNTYLQISARPAWDLLDQLRGTPPHLAHYRFRQACNLTPCPRSRAVVGWLTSHRKEIGKVLETKLTGQPVSVFDWSVDSLELGSFDPERPLAFRDLLLDRRAEAKSVIGVGRYHEPRLIYQNEVFDRGLEDRLRRPTLHLGIDLFTAHSSPVFSPLEGIVHSFQENASQDYGPTLVLRHDVGGEVGFFTLYGQISKKSLHRLKAGRPVAKGERIAWVAPAEENGGWPAHVHFQIITDLLGHRGVFPGVALPEQGEIWRSLCPDPNLILQIGSDKLLSSELGREELLRVRSRHVGPSLSIAYRKPLQIVRGFGSYLYDEVGRPYLDAVNNVAHVGHCHPEVVRAAAEQMAVLNTNTRYLHNRLTRYARRLCALFPPPLDVCFLVCSGSEANELALRLARTYTGQRDVIVLEGGYHGNTGALIEISSYKFDGPGGTGPPPYVHKVPMPDLYRGEFKASDPEAGRKYGRSVQRAVRQIQQSGRGPAAFIYESMPGCGGQIVLPEGYLGEAQRWVREAGGVCIADEVQVGFGRAGSHFWAFQTQGVVPDIVTLGKPIGNGHPLAAVVTRREIADRFNNGMEYFNTFGGNPVSCAVGLAVLAVIEKEGLQENALRVGRHLKGGLKKRQTGFPIIGDVRGRGLFLGVELVSDTASLAPAAEEAAYVVERMKENGILISADGPWHNVLKIKPPLVFSQEDADYLVATLESILNETFLSTTSLGVRSPG
ncbi:MAG: aminotransferase class III-fold pyridoxal phosphate-dependent enzyme [Acidobacteriota bacterium]